MNLDFTVDSTPPTIQANIPSSLSQMAKEINLNGQVEDASGIRDLQLNLVTPNNRTMGEVIELVSSATQQSVGQIAHSAPARTTNASWTYTDRSRFTQVGTYQLWIEAQDMAGNRTQIGPFDLAVTAPEQLYLPFVPNYDPNTITIPDAPDLSLGGDTIITNTIGGTSIQLFNIGTVDITSPFRVDLYLDPTSQPTSGQTWDTLSQYGAHWLVNQPIPVDGFITLPLTEATNSNYPGTLNGLAGYTIQLDTLGDVAETHDINPALDDNNINEGTWLPSEENGE